MSTTTATHHPVPLAAAAAAAAVAIALGVVAFSIADDSGGSVAPSDQGNHVLAPPQHGSGHYEYQSGGGTLLPGA